MCWGMPLELPLNIVIVVRHITSLVVEVTQRSDNESQHYCVILQRCASR